MKRRILVLILALILICATALAETKEYLLYVYLYEVLEAQNITFPTQGGAAVKKNDGDQYFYLTSTSTNLPSGRYVYFRSMYAKRADAIASGYITVNKNTTATQKTKYLSGLAKGGHTYYLGAAGRAVQGDPFMGSYAFTLKGRWTP